MKALKYFWLVIILSHILAIPSKVYAQKIKEKKAHSAYIINLDGELYTGKLHYLSDSIAILKKKRTQEFTVIKTSEIYKMQVKSNSYLKHTLIAFAVLEAYPAFLLAESIIEQNSWGLFGVIITGVPAALLSPIVGGITYFSSGKTYKSKYGIEKLNKLKPYALTDSVDFSFKNKIEPVDE